MKTPSKKSATPSSSKRSTEQNKSSQQSNQSLIHDTSGGEMPDPSRKIESRNKK